MEYPSQYTFELVDRLKKDRTKLFDLAEQLDHAWDDEVKNRFYINIFEPLFHDTQSYLFHLEELLRVLNEIREKAGRI